MSETEISRDEERPVAPRKLDRKALRVFIVICVGLALLIALNMN